MNASPPALEIENVSHRYGARLALDGVNFAVAPSSFTVLLGLNGAGKSTLFSLITRLYATRQGRISIYGRDISREPGAALAQLGVVFQSRALDADISVEQNLIYHAALHGIGPGEAKRRAREALARVDLVDRLHDKVSGLSGGQARRVEIARALIHRPRLLLLGHVRRLIAEEQIGVLWATHLIDEAGPDDDVVVLHKGRIRGHGAVPALLAQHGEANLGALFARLSSDGEAGEAA